MNILCVKKNKSFPSYLKLINTKLKKVIKTKNSFSIKESTLSLPEKKLLQQVNEQTFQLNKNNVTRTQAYLDFYQKYPEVEWAFLAHMVSRNSGWNMTDLKGEFHSKLLSENEQLDFFQFLERGNWLIFQDAYPQLLIYEASIKNKQPLFHLLPHLHISRFMEVLWEYFWNNDNCALLTCALIINEQANLQEKVIQNPIYKQAVLNTFEFKLQEIFRFTHILFPKNDTLVGQTVYHFDSLKERILLGKRLYSLLFSDKQTFKSTYKWAINNPHTGSRQDYWPHIFNDVKESLPGQFHIPQLKNCELQENGHRIYSPKLIHSWSNIKHKEAEKEDWFEDLTNVKYLKYEKTQVNGEIREEYCETLEKLEWAVYVKKAIFHYKD